ncbi:MAG TPA: hypothetical protein VGZ73_25815, partial [Bryobacteraceae bacterium]|nr:hypothetical protein [Bryobacteraceae bacterium]
MTDVNILINRIDQVLEVEVKRGSVAWTETVQATRDREQRLQRYEPVAKHIIDLLKPRMEAFIERFKDVVRAEPSVRQHTRAMHLTFAATVAKVSLTFEVYPNRDVSQIRLECTQEIVPVLVSYDKQLVLEIPLDAVRDDVVVQWFDERILAFVKTYLAIVRQDA